MKKELSSSSLHIIAMFFMLLDHIWGLFGTWTGFTCLGRIAFPIFAFLLVEGYFHTSNLKMYILRLLCLAIISEIPFNLMYAGTTFYIVHQNVIWTLLIGLISITLIEKIKKKGKLPLTIALSILIVLVATILGFATFVDYYGIGVLTIFVFYFFRGVKWWCLVGQLVSLAYLNLEVLGGLAYPVTIFGIDMEIKQQAFAIIALFLIWLYKGEKGIKSKAFNLFCYVFYPLHMLFLYLIYLATIK